MGLLGVFQPYLRGVFWNALVIAYAVTSVVSGYTSVSFYCQLEGTSWVCANINIHWGLYEFKSFIHIKVLIGPQVFLLTDEKPTADRRIIFRASPSYILHPKQCCHFLWNNCCIANWSNSHFISFVDILSITIASFRMDCWQKRASGFEAPCKTAKCPREVPQLRW